MTDAVAARTPRRWAVTVLFVLAVLHLLGMLATFVLIGGFLFEGVFPRDAHIGGGSIAFLAALLATVFGALARLGRRAWVVPLVLVVLDIVQHFLPAIDGVSMLHPLNGALLLLIGFSFVAWTWRGRQLAGGERPNAPAV